MVFTIFSNKIKKNKINREDGSVTIRENNISECL